MFKALRIAVVVPAYNEETQIGRVLETLPPWIDRVIVVDDASTDRTAAIAQEHADRERERFAVVRRPRNCGVGAAIADGYRRALDGGADIAVVMAGDGQMNPDDLPALLEPVASGEADYAKGNRLILGDAWQTMPRARLLGGAVLSFLTKIASGYWHVSDSQNGYTAIGRRALEQILRDGFYERFGMPNDVLVKLNVHGFAVRDVPMHAVYNVGERSKMRIPAVILPICWLLVRRFFYRMWHRYVVRDTHPLVLFYLLGLAMTPLGVLYGLLILLTRVVGPTLLGTTLFAGLRPFCSDSGIVLDAVVTLLGAQSILFAMWFDMQHNSRLR
jgi:glycosyltransferase involved in cell wall biosynthesis